ncbi:MAG: Gldg family protein [Nitrospirota bacterium]
MKSFRAILSRELRSYFDSPIAYIFLVVFILVNCGLYMSSFFFIGRAEMRTFFNILPMVLVIFIPAITMRLWAEEKKIGTIELLMTLPMETHHIVLGKFAAGIAFFIISLVGTWTIPVTLSLLGNPDFGPLMGGYIGSAFLGAFFLSVGIFTSGICRDQIVAFILGLILCFFFYFSGTDYIAAQIDGWSGFLALGTKIQDYISLTGHFAGIERGVIDIKDIIYFVSMTALFLLLNVQFLNGRMKTGAKGRFIASAIIFAGITIFVNVVASGFSAGRFDLTDGKIFTVSEASKKMLRELKVPVKVRFYVTAQEKMPTPMKNLERDVVDKLEELKIASDNKLTYEISDPSSNPELEQKLQKKGIMPFQVQSVEQDEIGVKIIYSSMTISYLDKPEEIIRSIHFQNLHNLEYELISKIYKLTLDKMPKIAVYASREEINPQMMKLMLQMGRRPPEPEYKYNNLEDLLRQEKYNVVRIDFDKDNNIPEDADTLLVISPRNLNDRQRYEINRFVVEGGNLILAVQNYIFNYSPAGVRGMQIIPNKVNPNINQLIKDYGVSVDDSILMDNNHEILSIPTKQNIGGLFTATISTPVKVPIQIKAIQENMNSEVSISSRISSLLYLWGSRLALDEGRLKENGLTSRTLISSGKESWTVSFTGKALTKEEITPHPARFEGSQPLSVLVEGQFPDLYKGKGIPTWPGESKKEEKKELKPSPGKMILIGDGEMFNNNLLSATNNALFMLNSVDSLSLGEDIINIRSKTQVERFIQKISPAGKLWYRFFVILFIPIIVIIAGVIRFMARRKKKIDYSRMLGEVGFH